MTIECHDDLPKFFDELIKLSIEQLSYEVIPGVKIKHNLTVFMENLRHMIFDKV